jgi:hypothetical protein
MVISYVQSDDKSLSDGIQLIGLILLLKAIKNLAESHMSFSFSTLGFNLSNSLTLCIYDKALKYPTLCSKKFPTSELINYSEVDAQRMSEMAYSLSDVILLPIAVGSRHLSDVQFYWCVVFGWDGNYLSVGRTNILHEQAQHQSK